MKNKNEQNMETLNRSDKYILTMDNRLVGVITRRMDYKYLQDVRNNEGN